MFLHGRSQKGQSVAVAAGWHIPAKNMRSGVNRQPHFQGGCRLSLAERLKSVQPLSSSPANQHAVRRWIRMTYRRTPEASSCLLPVFVQYMTPLAVSWRFQGGLQLADPRT